MIKWGIIGAGDVAEIKSGPAFNLVDNSTLLAIMRRNTEKAKDFATRHHVPIWYDKVDDLLANADINAVYIATPPSSHLEIAKKALDAGKFVYLEKPMTRTLAEAVELKNFVKPHHKIVVAHYRRELPAFKKVKQLIDGYDVGTISHATIEILQKAENNIITKTEDNWRLKPEVSGGGYFHDIAPHQLDLMLLYFGDYKNPQGFATASNNKVADFVKGMFRFKNEVHFRGTWDFTGTTQTNKDECIIFGYRGSITFSFYGNKVSLRTDSRNEEFTFDMPKHIQQPMIASTVKYFLGEGDNPCTVEDGLATLQIIDSFTNPY